MPASSRSALFLAVLLAMSVLTGCSASNDDGASGETRVVATEEGDVTIPEDPQKIVVLNSALAGYFYALDEPLHGAIPLNPEADEFPGFWADAADEAGTVMVPWSNDGFDFEFLLNESPDLIVGGGQGFPGKQASDAYDQLSDIAPTVLVSDSFTTWQDDLDFIADDILDKADAARQLRDSYDDRVAEVRDAITAPQAPVAYLLMLSDMTPWSIPEDASLPATLSDVGIEADTVLADNPQFETFGSGDSFEVTTEQVSNVFTAPTVFVLGFQTDVTTAEELADNEVYASLPAFEAERAYDLPYWAHRADYDATMALLDQIESMFG